MHKIILGARAQRSSYVAIVTTLFFGALINFSPPSVQAAGTIYTVGTLADSQFSASDCVAASNTDCTLRNAIAIATSGNDTIQFRPSLSGGITLNGSLGSLVLSASVTISGPGAMALALDGGYTGSLGGVTVFVVSRGAVATVSGLTIQHGKGSVMVNGDGGDGGGIFNAGTLTLRDCVITNSVAGIASTNGSGGGVFNAGLLTMTNTTISGNSAGNSGNGGNGGGIANRGTITMTASVVNGNRTFDIGNDMTLSGNGGGVMNDGVMTVTASTFTNNSAAASYGGGIDTTARGTLTIMTSTVDSNTAGINGGGLVIDGTGSIESCTISNNTASNNGGGIASYGTLMVATSTVSHNTATYKGGGVWTNNRTVIGTSTLAKNTAAQGGGIAISFGPTTLGATLVGTNSSNIGPDISGTLANDDDYNLLGSTSGVIGLNGMHDVLDRDPLIADLAGNGGATRTHALKDNSPAVNAGGGSCPAVDQRSVPRPQGTACDIGAFEAQVSIAPAPHLSATPDMAPQPQPQPIPRASSSPPSSPGPMSTPRPQPQPPRH